MTAARAIDPTVALLALLDRDHRMGFAPTLLAFTAAALKAGIAVRDSSDVYRQVIGSGRYTLLTDADGYDRLHQKPPSATPQNH